MEMLDNGYGRSFFFNFAAILKKDTFLFLLTPARLTGNVLSNMGNVLQTSYFQGLRSSILSFYVIFKAHSTKDFSAHSTFKAVL
jgi:hypothetical protein